ncbi:AAA family ATPase [Aquibacillus rhizosphaerae]|uniref:AAA family ATPase n=1 Tax=Aquibacillus rhizosphaerae TaxID=3051431 RepID=A0ABT7LAB3_9BACI|nr:AAA family ATPase [Aquibacillus sp. LR5S19]MDL4842793.1 AAA family ATPase [Aquibacillus sp. LR5S19]
MVNIRNMLNSITIERFRKLKGIEIDIANRITVIAGHNGIGKSTILGLVANGSELKGHKSYFDKIYQSQFQEIFHLDERSDYINNQDEKYSTFLKYEYEGEELLKKCTVSRHGDRLKVVPRNVKEDGKLTNQHFLNVGADAKVPIPTIYVGMSRVIPIGESDKSLYSLSSSTNVHEDDIRFINEAFTEIIGNESVESERISKQNLKHSSKRSIGPEFTDYPFQTVSLGQDSLSTIITSIISFKKLKRELGDEYKGGILVIDEVDACLHPSAQEKLIGILDKASKQLNLQIIVTSHSLTIIKEIIGKQIKTRQNPADDNLYYNVIYLQNTINPKIMRNPTYKKIKNDMFLRFNFYQDNDQEIKIYFEDDEALFFYKRMASNIPDLNIDGIRFDAISASMSCDTLLKLPSKDSYFQSVIILADGDVKKSLTYQQIIDNYENMCALPGRESPEKTIHLYLEELVADQDHIFWTENQDIIHSQLVRDNLVKNIDDRIRNLTDKKMREEYKNWFRENIRHFENTNIIRHWMNDNPDNVAEFVFQFKIAVDYIRNNYIMNDL